VPPLPPVPPDAAPDPALAARLAAVCDDGWALWEAFERAPRAGFHPFVPADCEAVCAALLPFRAPGRRWLEWGSGAGTLTVAAALLGFDASGIELDAALVDTARALAARHGAAARFAAGSFLPAGYEYRAPDGDRRTGTLGSGPSGYLALGRALEDFDVVFGYPWDGEAPLMRDLMRRYGRPDAVLLLNDPAAGVQVYPGGREPGR
jgi:hypothetical protein